VAEFRSRLEDAGGLFLQGPSLDPLLPALAEILRAEGVTALFAPRGDEAASALAEGAAPFGPFALAGPQEIREAGFAAWAGIRSAEFAVAETGSIVETSREGRTLLAGLLPPVHVAVLSPACFVERMDECLAALAPEMPRNISFITGPSRTADIEQTLTVGAHGPRRVVAVLVSP